MDRFAANCSLLFSELPLLERPAAAKAAGFDAVEFWWPFDAAVPTRAQQDDFVAALDDAGVTLVGLNFYAGDMPGGDRGLVSWPGRERAFRVNTDIVVSLGERTGCRSFNALYGNRIASCNPAKQDALAIDNLVYAARAVDRIGGTVLVEPVSGAPKYPLLTAAEAIGVINAVRAAGATNIGLLADLYHLAVNGDDVAHALDTYADQIAHVQIADAPGRNEPGTGELDITGYLDQLTTNGYTGWIAAEYKPTGATTDTLGWVPRPALDG